MSADGLHIPRNGDGGQTVAVQEGGTADFGDRGGNDHIIQIGAVIKQVGRNLGQTSGEGNALQRVIVGQCPRFQHHVGVPEGDLRQPTAAAEGVFPDAGHVGGEGDP